MRINLYTSLLQWKYFPAYMQLPVAATKAWSVFTTDYVLQSASHAAVAMKYLKRTFVEQVQCRQRTHNQRGPGPPRRNTAPSDGEQPGNGKFKCYKRNLCIARQPISFQPCTCTNSLLHVQLSRFQPIFFFSSWLELSGFQFFNILLTPASESKKESFTSNALQK